MGLTVAEAFMLIVFVLLMLLLFWRHQVQDEVDLASQLSPEERRVLSEGAILVPPKRLEDLKRQAERVSGVSEQRLQALKDGAVTVSPERLEDLEVQAGLMEDPGRRALADAAAALEPDVLRKLTQLARNSNSLWFEENEDDIIEAWNLRRALDPEGENRNEELMARIGDLLAKEDAIDNRLAEEAAAHREFIANLKRELAADVQKAGGEIDPSGRVVFPETVVFKAGSAVIPPGFKAMLDDICPRWLAELRNSADRFEIDEIRIEGHSSPEWASAQDEWDAWVANLGLSQRRAQSVLENCLDHVAGTSLGEWARDKLTAVGYSSSRPATVNGKEDFNASRRVVLGHEFSRDRLIADLGDAGGWRTGSGAVPPIRGNALVIDADTIEIGETGIRVRFDSIVALELDQTCIAADGSEWYCGREAGLALERHIDGRDVVCDRLHPSLMGLRGICKIEGEEVELNRWVVEAGWAFASVKSSNAYVGVEVAAREAKRGIWSGKPPMPPWKLHENLKGADNTR